MEPGNPHVYVLELGNGNFYVGYTLHLKHRLSKHKNPKCKSAKWVDLHGCKNVLEIHRGGKDIETKLTLKYMRAKGFDKVRGASWTMVAPLPRDPTLYRQ
jgi:predicted GIY-YIG superfamily endonuclease